MATYPIYIYAGYNGGSRRGELEMSEQRSEVDQGIEIEWIITNQRFPGSIEVDSIEAIEIESGDKIFKINPRRDQDNKMKGHVKTGLGRGKQCKYSIHWSGADYGRYIHDPIIAVKPTSVIGPAPLPKLLAGLALGLGAIFTITYFQKKITNRRNHKQLKNEKNLKP